MYCPVGFYFVGRMARHGRWVFAKQEGQGLVEYGLILVLIMVVVAQPDHLWRQGQYQCTAQSTAASVRATAK